MRKIDFWGRNRGKVGNLQGGDGLVGLVSVHHRQILDFEVAPVSWTPDDFVFEESTMGKTRRAYPPEFHRQMVDLVRAGRSR